MVDIQTVSIAIASASVVAGIVYYTLQIRHQTKIRKMDLVMRLYSAFISKEITEAGLMVGWSEYRDYNDFLEKYGQMGPEKPMWVAVNQISNFLNEVGMLLHREFIEIELVDELFGYRIAVVWEKMKPLIEGMRKQLNPRVGEWFEYLYNEMKKREQRQ
jgi:hypothetical protein